VDPRTRPDGALALAARWRLGSRAASWRAFGSRGLAPASFQPPRGLVRPARGSSDGTAPGCCFALPREAGRSPCLRPDLSHPGNLPARDAASLLPDPEQSRAQAAEDEDEDLAGAALRLYTNELCENKCKRIILGSRDSRPGQGPPGLAACRDKIQFFKKRVSALEPSLPALRLRLPRRVLLKKKLPAKVNLQR